MSNALLTRRVTDAVTLPRPDPTRPDPSTTAEVIHTPQVVGDPETTTTIPSLPLGASE